MRPTQKMPKNPEEDMLPAVMSPCPASLPPPLLSCHLPQVEMFPHISVILLCVQQVLVSGLYDDGVQVNCPVMLRELFDVLQQ